MNPPRNQRRACDANGNETPPVTVRQSLAEGYRTVMAYCDAHNCGHGAEVPLKGLSPNLPVPDMARGCDARSAEDDEAE